MIDSKPEVTVKEGQSTIIPCATQGYPLPITKWFRKVHGDELHPLIIGTGNLQKTGSGLRITKVKLSDSGIYVCEVSNDVGNKQVETMLTVTGDLHVEIKPAVHVVELGRPVTLKCSISGNPVKYVRWVHNSKWLPSTNDTVGTTSVLHLPQVKLSDRGMYQCFAGNGLQSTQVTTELSLHNVVPKFVEVFEERVVPPGQSLSLKCVVFGLPPPQMSWSVDFSGLRRSGNGSHVEERVDVTGNTVSVLHLQSVSVKDAGLYQCTASSKAGRLLHSAKINVHGPPFGRQVPKQIYVAGTTVYIHCPVYGHPIQVYQWEKEGRLLPINLRQAVYPNGTLVIEKVKKVVDAGRYTCSAWNKNGQRAQVNILVDVSVPPKITPFSFQEQLIREGMRARLQCVVSDGDLPIRILWLKDGDTIDPDLGVTVRDLDEFSSILTINKITPHNNGNYTCTVSNSAGSAHHTASLFVNVPPRLLVEPEDTSVALGHSVILHCQAGGSPQPSITWMKADGIQPGSRKEIITTNSRLSLYGNGSLLLERVEAADEGFYVCQATNGIDEGLSIVMHLYVNVPPQVKASNRSSITRIRTNVTLMCEVFGDEPVDVSWSRNSVLIPVTRNSRFRVQTFTTERGKASELFIQSITREDSTFFTCSASNAFGSDGANISVLVHEPPDVIKKIKVASPTSRSVEILWDDENFDGNSPILGYVLEYRQKDLDAGISSDYTNVSMGPREFSAIINELLPATKYEVRIYSRNKLGRSNYSQVIDFITAEEAPSAPPQDVRVTSVDVQAVKVTWKPPKPEFHNGKLRGYRVGYKIHGVGDPLVYKSLDASNASRKDLSVVVDGLKKFTIYEFVVEAYNGPGIGPASEPVLATTTEDVPSLPPSDVRCFALTSKSISLNWNPPPPLSINGILQGYTVVYKPIDEWHVERSQQRNVTVKESKHVLESLKKFTNYSLQVCAYTKAGAGAISSPVFCKTLEDFPEAPSSIMVVPASESSVVVAWKPPIHINGLLKKYDVYVRKIYSPTKVFEKFTMSPSESFFEVKNLSQDYRYEFWVTASTSVGESVPSKVIAQHPGDHSVPAKIVSFGDKVVSLWKSNVSLPCRTIGRPVPNLRWYYRDKAIKGSERHHVNQDGSLDIYLLSSEDEGTYSCKVKNELGKEEIDYEIQVLEPPHPPDITIVTTTLDSIEIKWVPGRNVGFMHQDFELQYRAEDEIPWKRVNISSIIERYKLENLRCGTKYQIRMAGINRLGVGHMSSLLKSSTDGAAPTEPEKEKLVEEGVNSVTLQLSSFVSNGCPITQYVVEHKPKGSKEWFVASDTFPPPEKHFIISNLEVAAWHSVRVTAHNSAGKAVAQYDFATLTLDGGTIAPDFASDEGFVESSGILSDWDQWVIVASTSAVVALLSVLIVTCLCVKHKKRQQRNDRGAYFGAFNAGGDKHNLRIMRDASELDFTYLRSNPDRNRFGGKGHGRSDKKNDFLPYSTPHLNNHEMALYNSHTLLKPQDADVSEGSGKEDSQTLPRFAKPKPYQSGFRTPTHDSGNRGLRTSHPVPIPTAPPIVDLSALRKGSANGKTSAGTHKGNNKLGTRLKRTNGKAGGEVTFVFPPPLGEHNHSTGSAAARSGLTSTSMNIPENIYENVPSGE